MHGDHANAGSFRAARELRRIDAGVIPAEPHFQRDRHAHGGDGCLDQGQRVIEIAHQRRAGGAVGHLLGRAAHVDVDDVRALRLGDAGAFRHPMRLAAGELHDVDGDALSLAAHARFALALDECGARGHFRNHQTRAVAFREPAEGRVGDARHWRQNHAVRHLHGADLQRIACNLVDFAPHGMTAYHLGGPFQCSEFSHFDSGRKCCTAKSCSCLNASRTG